VREVVDIALSSIAKQTYPNFEVIFVDGGSVDSTVDFVKENYPDVKLVKQSRHGAAEATNVGVLASNGEYIMTWDADAKAEPDLLERLVNVMESDDAIGMCAPKVLQYNDPNFLDYAGTLIYRDFSFIARGLNELELGQYNKVEEVFSPMGALALYRKTMLFEIGLCDSDLEAYPEDFELAFRGRLAGWKCIYVPKAVGYHMHGYTGGRASLKKMYFLERNRIWCILKDFPMHMIVLSIAYTLLRYFVLIQGWLSGKGSAANVAKKYSKKDTMMTLLRAWFDSLRGMPRALKKRRIVQSTRKVTRAEIEKWFKDYEATASDVVFKVDKPVESNLLSSCKGHSVDKKT